MAAKKKETVSEPIVKWDLRTPDDVLAQSWDYWSREIEGVECAVVGCEEACDAQRVLCDKHLYRLMNIVKNRAAQNPKIREKLNGNVVVRPAADGRNTVS